MYIQSEEIDASTFTNRKVKTLVNPYTAHEWDSKGNIWRRLQFFESGGILRKRTEIKRGEYKQKSLTKLGIGQMLLEFFEKRTIDEGEAARVFHLHPFGFSATKINRNLEFLETEGFIHKVDSMYKITPSGIMTAKALKNKMDARLARTTESA